MAVSELSQNGISVGDVFYTEDAERSVTITGSSRDYDPQVGAEVTTVRFTDKSGSEDHVQTRNLTLSLKAFRDMLGEEEWVLHTWGEDDAPAAPRAALIE